MSTTLLESQETEDEPVGIVIAAGNLPEPAPRFCAYVWGQADEPAVPEPQPPHLA